MCPVNRAMCSVNAVKVITKYSTLFGVVFSVQERILQERSDAGRVYTLPGELDH